MCSFNFSDMMPVQALPTSLVHQQLYLPQPSVAARSTPIPQQAFKTAPKRPRSPSPQPAVPVSLYHQGYGYKPTTVVNTSYQTSPQSEYNANGALFIFYYYYFFLRRKKGWV